MKAALIDIKAVQEEAEKEIRDERAREAKTKLKISLKRISDAELVVANLKREHEDIIRAIADGN